MGRLYQEDHSMEGDQVSATLRCDSQVLTNISPRRPSNGKFQRV